MANTLQQFTGEEVISTDLVPKLNNNFNYLKANTDSLNTNINNLKDNIDSLDTNINSLNNQLSSVNQKFGGMKFEIDSEDGGLNIIVE